MVIFLARPRDYQKDCIKTLVDARAEGRKKALVVMASGLGKTLTAAFDVKNYLATNPSARVLVLCHSADILRQTKEVFKVEFGDEYSYGLYNSTEKARRRTDFTFANLQSVDLHKEDFDPKDFDYIIVDEAHHSAATTYGRSIEYFDPDFILGLTATPDRMDGQELDQFFGEPVYSKDLIVAIKEGLLSDIDYYVEIDEANRKRIRKMIGEDADITYAQIDGLASNNYTANEDVVAKICQQLAKMDDPTTVIFCQTIEHADAIHALMPNESAIMYSKYDSATNAENIAKFRRGDIKTIIAINMFNEGINIPRTDVVVFLRITQSKTIFLQQLGRGLRKTDSKEKVVVLDFVGTGARIRQIMDFEGEFSVSREGHKKSSSGNSKGGPGYGHFNLHLGGHESYESVAVELAELLDRAHTHGYTDTQLINFLQRVANKLGHSPSPAEIRSIKNAPTRAAFIAHFGGNWNDVLVAANLEPIDNYYYDDSYMIEILKIKCSELGRFPKMTEIAADARMPDPASYANHFGSLSEAISRAEIDLSKYPRAHETYSDERIIADFKTECERLGRIPMYHEFILHPAGVYRKRFGGLHKIAALSGCQEYWRDYPQRSRSFSKDEGLRLLVEKSESINRPLSAKEIQDDWELPRPQWYSVNFGGIWEALRKGGYRGAYPRKAGVKKFSPETAVEAIRTEYKSCGRTLKRSDFEDNPNLPSPTCIAGLFGTISVALLWSGVPVGQFRHTNNPLAIKLLAEMGIPNDRDSAMALARSLSPDSTHPARLLLK